jgi:hypothetical protein
VWYHIFYYVLLFTSALLNRYVPLYSSTQEQSIIISRTVRTLLRRHEQLVGLTSAMLSWRYSYVHASKKSRRAHDEPPHVNRLNIAPNGELKERKDINWHAHWAICKWRLLGPRSPACIWPLQAPLSRLSHGSQKWFFLLCVSHSPTLSCRDPNVRCHATLLLHKYHYTSTNPAFHITPHISLQKNFSTYHILGLAKVNF